MATGNDELLGVDEVAAYLGVGPVTIHRWCRDGKLPCIKLGKSWRIRRGAVDDFLRRRERGGTLQEQLDAFITVPDHVVAMAEDLDLLRRLDSAFFRVGEARGGFLVKFYGGEEASADELREEFERNGLDTRRLEAQGRMRLTGEQSLEEGRAAALRALLQERSAEGQSIWASFNMVQTDGVEEALREQEELADLVDSNRLVIKAAAVQGGMDEWPPEAQRRLQQMGRGLIWASRSRLMLSRGTPMPRD